MKKEIKLGKNKYYILDEEEFNKNCVKSKFDSNMDIKINEDAITLNECRLRFIYHWELILVQIGLIG